MVGARGFEPPTPWSQTRCATRLRYAPLQLRTLHEYPLGGDLARTIDPARIHDAKGQGCPYFFSGGAGAAASSFSAGALDGVLPPAHAK
jgi:hypothetical protein